MLTAFIKQSTRLSLATSSIYSTSSLARYFSQAIVPSTEAITDSSNVHVVDVNQSKRLVLARKRNVKGSVKKMAELLHRVRELPVDEAMHQMKFHAKARRSTAIADAILSAKRNAINTFNMDPARLYVAEAFSTRAKALRRVALHARGRASMMQRRFSHLTIKVKERSEEEMSSHRGRFGTLSDTQVEKRKKERARRSGWLRKVKIQNKSISKLFKSGVSPKKIMSTLEKRKADKAQKVAAAAAASASTTANKQ